MTLNVEKALRRWTAKVAYTPIEAETCGELAPPATEQQRRGMPPWKGAGIADLIDCSCWKQKAERIPAERQLKDPGHTNALHRHTFTHCVTPKSPSNSSRRLPARVPAVCCRVRCATRCVAAHLLQRAWCLPAFRSRAFTRAGVGVAMWWQPSVQRISHFGISSINAVVKGWADWETHFLCLKMLDSVCR